MLAENEQKGKREEKAMRKRIFAAFVCLCMMVSLVPSRAYADGTDNTVYTGGLCEHHTQHDSACGYSEATAEVPCNHVHTEDCYTQATNCVHAHTAECYSDGILPAEGEEKTADSCAHQCSEESGCIKKELHCNHEHDASCGYVPAKEGTPCNFVCEICNAQAVEEPECICDTKCTEEEVNADCPVCGGENGNISGCIGAEKEPQCVCDTKCTEEEINEDCPLCSAEGAELDKVCVGAAPMLLGAPRSAKQVTYLDENGNEKAVNATVISGSQWNTGWYVSDANLYTFGDRITINGNVNLILANGNTIECEKGICVPNGSRLTIYAQSTDENIMGKLSATVDEGNAGIGGNKNDDCGKITINGGYIEAIGTNGGAGIGGGMSRDCGEITINGGMITAKVETFAAGIGGGNLGDGGTITINGGTVTANATSGAGIGGGNGSAYGSPGNGGNITITGGNVKASSTAGAGIGGGSGIGSGGSGGIVKISGGIVTATSRSLDNGAGGAGIGGSNLGAGGDVIITGGIVTATAETGTSIGAGASGGSDGTLTIAPTSGKVITADAGTDKSSSIPLEGSPFTNSKEVISQLTGTKYFHSETKNMTVITQHPNDQRVNDGSSAIFTISATGDNLTYQWQQSTDNGGSWTNINGANLSSYTTGTTTMDMSGYQYRCIVIGAGGSVTSNAATLTVKAIPVAEVKLNENNITLTVGDIETLTATVEPTNATNKTVMWSSSNDSVAMVDSNGNVTGIGRGFATITAKATDGNVSATCNVEVKQLVTDINLTDMQINVGETKQVQSKVLPENANEKALKWESIDPSIATVDSQTGEVTGISKGTATIIATATDGSNVSATCEVEVKQQVIGITLDKTELSLYTGRSETLTATVKPDNANDKSLIWSSDNEDVATVDQNGNVKAISRGEAVITATAADGQGAKAECKVTVRKKSSGGSVFFWDLKFDTNGGSDIDTVTEWEYSTIDLDEYVPEKEGYKFVGWYADEDLTKKIDEVYLLEDTTVYAKWEKVAEEVPEEPEETEETETISFKDVKESDWFYEAVSYAVENGLMSGMSEDIFAPNTPLTREMLAVVLYNVEGQPESTEANTFTDVKADMWYTDAILWANENGIVAGYDNGAYGVGDLITREQFATILYRYAQFKGYDTTQGGMAVREFSDYETISDYARPAMAWAVNAGIMGGMDDGTLMPQGKATRAEAATMLMNFCENVMEK